MGRAGILVVSAGNHPGIDHSLRELSRAGVVGSAYHFEFERSGAQNPTELWASLTERVRSMPAAYVLLHHYNSRGLPDPRPWLTELRKLESKPIIALSLGDPFYNGFFRPYYPPILRGLAAEVDLVLNTSMGETADYLAAHGAQRIALWPLSACPVRFSRPSTRYSAREADYDVVFIGSNNRSLNPAHSYFWYARQRERMVRKLSKEFGKKFAVYGRGWDGLPTARGMADFSSQLEVCRQARVIVGGVPYSPARYYLSNRPFIQILSGVPFIDMQVEGADHILRDDEHWKLVDSLSQIPEACHRFLFMTDDEREELGAKAASYVAENHMAGNRWESLISTLQSLRKHLIEGAASAEPDLRFLLPEVDRRAELGLATRGFT